MENSSLLKVFHTNAEISTAFSTGAVENNSIVFIGLGGFSTFPQALLLLLDINIRYLVRSNRKSVRRNNARQALKAIM